MPKRRKYKMITDNVKNQLWPVLPWTAVGSSCVQSRYIAVWFRSIESTDVFIGVEEPHRRQLPNVEMFSPTVRHICYPARTWISDFAWQIKNLFLQCLNNWKFIIRSYCQHTSFFSSPVSYLKIVSRKYTYKKTWQWIMLMKNCH